ncbi:MAG: RNA polymerase sigma-70 factor [Bacteroides sp.]|nr:RNA polymerase sigma-70 factor [Bacteroides sp.]
MRNTIPYSSHEIRFKKLYEEYYAPFCLYAKRFIEDRYVREDIVSDVFATLWRRREEIDLRPETALAFLKMCVKNSCLNHIKHLHYEIDYAEVYKKKKPLYEQSPDTLYNLEELYELLYKSLEKLPENYRLVFIKHFFEGKTHAEIAEELRLSVKSIDRYKQKVIAILQEDLKDYLPLLLLVLYQSSGYSG